jgi:hypothetical protein
VSKPHDWVGATVLQLDRGLAHKATTHGKLTLLSKMVVEVLEVYCRQCRKTYTLGESQKPCRLGVQHIGGPRIQPDRDGWPVPHDPLD